MKTIGEVLALSAQYLQKHKVERAKREAEDLLALVLKTKRLDLYMDFSRPLRDEELTAIRDLLKKRGEGVPFGYLAKQVAFFGTLLEITPAVLVPRPETEIIVEKIACCLEKSSLEGKVLWDMCTGSGCIGLSLQKRFPELKVVLSDISEEAASLAQSNAALNRLDVEVRRGDLFAPFDNEKCDFFVCNPPYLTEEEYQAAASELTYEPKGALVGGVRYYQRIAKELPNYLQEGGKAFFEIGSGQAESVTTIFKEAGYERMRYENDYAGHPRLFLLE